MKRSTTAYELIEITNENSRNVAVQLSLNWQSNTSCTAPGGNSQICFIILLIYGSLYCYVMVDPFTFPSDLQTTKIYPRLARLWICVQQCVLVDK